MGRKRVYPEIADRRIVKIWQCINVRCTRPSCGSYEYYGGKGIKNLLTPRELEVLWNRDGAAQMKRPSIDRKDNSKSYTFDNCRFVELSDNRPGPATKPPTIKFPPISPLPQGDESWDATKRYFEIGDFILWTSSGDYRTGVVTKLHKSNYKFNYRISYWVRDELVYLREIERRIKTT